MECFSFCLKVSKTIHYTHGYRTSKDVPTYLELVVVVAGLRAVHRVLAQELLVLLDGLLVHAVQQLDAELDIDNKSVAAVLGKVLADDHAQHLQLVRVGSHGVSRDDPTAGTQLVCESKLIPFSVLIGLEAPRNERKSLARLLGHDDKVHGLERVGEVVGGPGQVAHDGAVSPLSEANQLVVLANNLTGALGEVEGE